MTRDPASFEAENDAVVEGESVLRKRPFGVTLFLWMVLSLSAWGLLRLMGALRGWDVLSQYRARLSPLYLSITGAGWVVAGIVLLWSIIAGKRWAYRAIPISIGVWLLEYWLERIFFQAARANLPFMLVMTVVVLAITLAVTVNRQTKNFLLRSEEHEQPKAHSVPE